MLNIYPRLKITIRYGLYLLAFLLPWQTRYIIKAGELNGGFWEYGTISLYASDILLLFLLALQAIVLFRGRKGQNRAPRLWPWLLIGGLELFVFLSIFAAAGKGLAVFGYLQLLLGIGLFWLAVKAEYHYYTLWEFFLAGALAQAGLAIIQFIAQGAWANKWLGLAAHYAGDLGVSVVELYGGQAGRWLRAYGGLDHPNILGALMALSVALAVWLRFSTKSSRAEKIFLTAVISAGFAGLLISFSRAAWLGLAAALSVFLFLAVKHRRLLAQKIVLESVLGFVIMALAFNLAYPGLLAVRIGGQTRLEKKSIAERVESVNIAQKIIKDRQILGVGVKNYTHAMYRQTDGQYQAYQYQPVHNTFLLVWAETGWGMIFYLLFLFYVFHKLAQKPYNSYLNGLLLLLLVILMFDHWLWSLHFGILLYWFILGMLYRKVLNTE